MLGKIRQHKSFGGSLEPLVSNQPHYLGVPAVGLRLCARANLGTESHPTATGYTSTFAGADNHASVCPF
jgi:hypothetical protein